MGKLKTKLKQNYIYVLAFIIPIIIMTVIYMLLGIYPAGNKTILNSDSYLQYVAFLGRIKDILKGDASIFYTFSKSLGGNISGLFAYYIISPLNLIIALFPKEYIAEAMAVITLIKIGLSSLTFTVYLVKTFNRKNIETLIFSLCYSLMAYNINFQLNIMWLDGVILLPLVILGIDKLINKNKYKLYVITLFLAIVTNYYIGYMICIFAVLYFIYKGILSSKFNFIMIRNFIGASVLAGALSAFILIPTILSLGAGKAKFRLFQDLLELMLRPDEIIAKLFVGNYSVAQLMGNHPYIYCGVIITILVLLYFMNRNISVKERILSGVLMFILLLSILISTLDLIWHGFDYPIGFEYRFSFLISFFAIILAYRQFISDDNISKLKISIMVLLGVVCAGYALKGDYEGLYDNNIVLTVTLFIAYITLIKIANVNKSYRCIKFSKANRSFINNIFSRYSRFGSAIKAITMVLVLAELSINAYSCLSLRSYVSRVRIYNYINDMQPIVNELKDNMDNFYRMEEVFSNTYNDSMLLNYYGITHSSSANDANIKGFMANMGIKSSSIFVKYNRGSTIGVDSLLGVKYHIVSRSAEDFSNYHYSENQYYNKILEENGYIVYENPSALPIAFMVNEGVKDVDTSKGNTFELNNSILSAMINNKKVVNTPLDVKEITSENLISTIKDGEVCYEKMDNQKEASITFTVTAVDNNPIYMFLKSEAYENGESGFNQVGVSINGVEKFTAFDSGNYNVECIGAFNRGEEVNISVTLNSNELYLKELQAYTFDVSEFEGIYKNLSSNVIDDIEYRDGYVKGTINVSNEKTLLYTSIPYDEGWNVTVDGKKVDYLNILDGLIGVELEEGEHTIEFKYRVPGLIIGSSISVLAFIGLLVFLRCNSKYRVVKKRRFDHLFDANYLNRRI